jgi:pyruvate dehydrogenase E1 component
VVTLAPDVSSSTNLGGWVNKVGVWSARERVDWFADDPETILHWRERPDGQHLELGIAETNLVGLLGELGATWSRWGEPLLPIGVLYDPFVERALEPWSFGIYAGGPVHPRRHPVRGRRSRRGGAHQSITTPSVGPGAARLHDVRARVRIDVEWTLLAALARLGAPAAARPTCACPPGRSTRPSPRSPTNRRPAERRRRQVVAGGYPLRRADGPPA